MLLTAYLGTALDLSIRLSPTVFLTSVHAFLENFNSVFFTLVYLPDPVPDDFLL